MKRVEILLVLCMSLIAMICDSCSGNNAEKQRRHEEWLREYEQRIHPSCDTVLIDSIVSEVMAQEEPKASSTTAKASRSTSSSNTEPDYFQMGYSDGYEDGTHLEKGRSFNNHLKGAAAREYKRGYFEGYPDGRADGDPNDDYVTGKNSSDYYDMKDDDDWSEDGDFDDDEDW